MPEHNGTSRKTIAFAAGLIALLVAVLALVWAHPGSMYGYGQGLQGLEALSFLIWFSGLAAILSGACTVWLVVYLVRRRAGRYGDYTIRRNGFRQRWIPTLIVLSFSGLALTLLGAVAGPRMLASLLPRAAYSKINHELSLVGEFAFSAEQATWSTQAFLDAVQNDDRSTIRKYLRYGADLNAQNGFGQTALHMAVLTSNPELVRMFLDRGADLDARDREGETPLHDACKKADMNILKLLLERGADIDAQSQYGTPLDIAESFHNNEAVGILREWTQADGKEAKE